MQLFLTRQLTAINKQNMHENGQAIKSSCILSILDKSIDLTIEIQCVYSLVKIPKDIITGDEVHTFSVSKPYTGTLKGEYMQFLWKKLHKDNIEVRVLLLTGGITVLNCCEIQVEFFQNLHFYRFHSKLQNIKFSEKLNYKKIFSFSILCYLNWNIKMYLRLVSGIIKGTLLSVKQFPVNNWSCYPKEKYFNVWGIYLRVSWIK